MLRLYLIVVSLLAGLLAALWLLVDRISAPEALRLARPSALILLGGAALVWGLAIHASTRRRASFWYSQTEELEGPQTGWVMRYARLPTILRVTALALIAIALARPQTFSQETRTVEGIDIMFVLDLSKSMEEDDLQRNRLDAGQRTIREFLRRRQGWGDRIGLVVFAHQAMLQCPLTLDYRSVESIVAGLRIGEVPALGTAIGDALGLALASLRRSESASKVVILLSDGEWNKAPFMDPYEASALSASMGVRVFTVLLGQEDGRVDNQPTYQVEPQVLKDLAAETGGEFFHADDDLELHKSFESIRKSLAKSENRVVGTTPHLQLYGFLVWPAFVLLLLELILRMTRFRRFP